MPNARRSRRLILLALFVVSTASVGACRHPEQIPAAERRAIADSLTALVTDAYDLGRPDAAERLLALYPDSGRVISAAAGRVTTTRDTLVGEIRGFWQRVGQNMREPRFELGNSYVDLITRDAAVVTLTYRIPHLTPRNSPHTVSGAWTMLWRRQDGRWRIVQEHLSDSPASSASGPDVPVLSPDTVPTPTGHQH